MKRMKALLGVVLVIAMVLSLSLTAFAAGETIKVLNPNETYDNNGTPTPITYEVYKIFDVEVNSTTGELVYKVLSSASAEEIAFLKAAQSATGLIVNDDGTITKTPQFDAATFATWLSTNKASIGAVHKNGNTSISAADMKNPGYEVGEPGYFYIEYSNGAPYALTTVLEGQTVSIENKNDMQFEKTANPANHTSVSVGDTISYTINGVVPAGVTNDDTYYYLVWDKLGAGLVLDPKTVTVSIGGTEVTTLADYTEANLSDPVNTIPLDARWINKTATTYTDAAPTFVVNLNLAGKTAGLPIVITYSAKVVADIGVLENTAHLVTEDYNKDSQTQHYTSKIVIDKYENGNAAQKLEGAVFYLMNENKDAYYTNVNDDVNFLTLAEIAALLADVDTVDEPDPTGTVTLDALWAYKVAIDAIADTTLTEPDPTAYTGGENDSAYIADKANYDAAVAADAVKHNNQALLNSLFKVTDSEGAAEFTGLANGTYWLYEYAAPTGYVALEDPIEITVNGAASLDSNNIVKNDPAETAENQNHYLKKVAQVANTPGSVLPSTGGRGTTMLYMAGLGMMLAAGAFLIFRRRAEAGK